MRLSDHAFALVVDRRYATEWPRVMETFGPLVGDLTLFLDGDGTMLPPGEYAQTTRPLPPRWSQGQGAYQHFCALNEMVGIAKSLRWDEFLLVEDDAVLVDGWEEIVSSAYASLPDDWEILYLGANHSDSDTVDVGPHLMRVNGSLTTHLVHFSSRVYDRVLDLQPRHVIDNCIAKRIHPDGHCYSAWPAASIQKPGPSYLWNMEVDYSSYFLSKGRNRCG